MSVAEVLDRALEGERLDDDDAAALLGSRDLVAIGRAAHELRNRNSARAWSRSSSTAT